MVRIRPVYDTFVLYLSFIIRLIAGLGFMVIAGRRLGPIEFAALGIIIAVVAMLGQATYLWAFWAQRAAAREDEHGGPRMAAPIVVTGLALTLAYVPLGALIYLLVSIVESALLGLDAWLLAYAAPYAALEIIHNYFRAVNNTLAPRILAIELAVYDSARLVSAYTLLVVAPMGLRGAILALTLGTVLAVGFIVLWYARNGYLSGRPQWALAREWLSAWRAPLLYTLTGLLRSLARPFLSWTTRSGLAVAYLNVGVSGQTVLLRATNTVTSVAYALSLRRPGTREVGIPLTLYFLIVGSITSLYIGLARPVATLYNPAYEEAAPVVAGMAVFAFLYGLAFLLRQILIGHYRGDIEKAREGGLMWQALKADVATMAAAYLVAAPATYLLRGDPLAAALALILALIAGRLVVIAVYLRAMREKTALMAPWRDIVATVLGVLAVLAYSVASGAWWLSVVEFWVDAPLLLPHLAAGGLVYLAVFLAISREARSLVGRIIERIGSSR